MMKTHPLLALSVALAGLVSMGAAAADAREDRAVSGFHAVTLSVPARMEVVQGDREGLTIEGDSDDLAKIETVVERGTLRIRKKDDGRWNWNMHRVNVTLYARTLDSMAISGSARIHAASIRSPRLEIAVSGSGDVDIPALQAEEAKFSISGSGKMKVAGKASSLDMHISGSGELAAPKLESRQASIHISGAGDAVVWAHDQLKVRVAGSGDVRYYGDPTIEQRVAGSGSVKRLGAAPG